MTITPMEPILQIDWEKVDMVRVTLEKPFGKSGGLRWRQGTSSAKKNMTYNANDAQSGPPWWPGQPIMYPEDGPAIAGDPERDSFVMPLQAAMTAFGHFYAPQEVPKNGVVGFTIGAERTRVAAMWSWFKMPPGDGTMHPPMNRIGAPDIPHVAIRPLSRNLRPMKNASGKEIVIRPFEFWKFDDRSMYDLYENDVAKPAAVADVAAMQAKIDELNEIVKTLVGNGKKSQS